MPNVDNWLETTHPSYASCVTQWDLSLDSYEGGVRYDKGDHLFRYSKAEGENTYEERKKRSARRNFVARVVNTVAGHLQSQPVERAQTVPVAVQEFQKAPVKGKPDTIGTFMDKVARYTFTCDRVFIVIDNETQTARTLLEEKQLGLKPYVYIVFPQDALDYEFGPDGKLNWIKIREWFRAPAAHPREAQRGNKTRYRIWFRDRWELWEKTDEKDGVSERMVGTGPNAIGEVPVVISDYEDGPSPYQGATPVHDIARLDRAIYNLESELDELGCRYTFSQLWINIGDFLANQILGPATDEFAPGQNGQRVDPAQTLLQFALKMGKGEALVTTGEGNGPGAGFISPDASQGELLLKMIDDKAKALFQLVSLQDEAAEAGGQAESGESKRRDFARLNTLLVKFARRLENVEWQITNIAAKWSGETADLPEDVIKYPKSYDVSALTDDLDEAVNMLTLLSSSKTAKLTIAETLLRKAWSELPDMEALIKKVLEEMSSAIDKAEEQQDFIMTGLQGNDSNDTTESEDDSNDTTDNEDNNKAPVEGTNGPSA